MTSSFENRLQKNWRHFSKWAKRRELSAFRVYDLDVPEWPFAVDSYAGRALVIEYPNKKARRTGSHEQARAEVLEVVQRVMTPGAIFTKTHEPHPWAKSQYGKTGEDSAVFTVEENGLKFEVNLGEYLDTGLFLDHRDTRARVRAEAGGKRFLNLFAYTGSFTVYAAAGGAKSTTTVDLSNTYCEWAERNLALNGLQPGSVERSDVLRWVEQTDQRFDLIVLDPPSFSVSKKMERTFNVQRDQVRLLQTVRGLLAPGGSLYFSTNFRGFELDPRIEGATELTPRSLPEDFHPGVHRCFLFGP